jgi:PhnB protein
MKHKMIKENHMARTYSYLHFGGTTEEAFNFYKRVFGTEFIAPIVRMGDLPTQPGMPDMSAGEKNLVMSVKLPIIGGHLLVGNDAPAWMGTVNHGNALDIGLDMDTRADADSIYAALAEGGTIDHELGEIYSGDYFGSVIDRFGTTWIVSCTAKA